MRFTIFFVPFMIQATFFTKYPQFFKKMLPAFGGSHDFESGTTAKS